jgi:hypothetical protein
MENRDRTTTIVLGPRTTVHAVVSACPELVEYLPAYDAAFGRLRDARGRVSWARITTLGDVALAMDVSWRRLVQDLAAEMRRRTGHAPRTVDDPPRAGAADPRLGDLREIIAGLERGGSLQDLAARLDALSSGQDAGETEVLAAAFGEGWGAEGGEPVLRAPYGFGDLLEALPEGHPIQSLGREGAQVDVLAAALGDELERLGGSPSRGRWRAARPLMVRLVDRLAGVEARVRRLRQAWLPALERNGAGDAAGLVRDRQDDVLDGLRLMRLTLGAEDPQPVLEHGRLLHARMRELSACEEEVLVPIAERALTPRDWQEVRLLEDAAGWLLIPPPPRWPRS